MTSLLFSVINAVESAQIKAVSDVVDVKDPSKGPLGAPDINVVAAVVKEVGEAAPISASLGDADFDSIAKHIDLAKSFADAGVQIVKIAVSRLSPARAELVIGKLRNALTERVKVVAAIYADESPKNSLFDFIATASHAGADGVLLDTAVKNGRSLFDHVDEETLRSFVSISHKEGLFVALAGSLGVGDIERLARVNPDYAGFRSAIASNGRNANGVDIAKVMEIRRRLSSVMVTAEA
ncbi:MAG: (5-formylfuran-3-yl)methyl phosphate synthase [Nitrospinae bacterium]|nr:(5-formylfuran-3-yl)methyl phosphate synthase [Nitrospinota bacterium]